jgi:hypothetical protein
MANVVRYAKTLKGATSAFANPVTYLNQTTKHVEPQVCVGVIFHIWSFKICVIISMP